MAAIAGYLVKCDVFLFDCVTTRIRRTSMNHPLQRISRSGDGHAYPALVALLMLAQNHDWIRIILAFAVSFAIELSSYKVLKHSIKRARPAQAIPGIELVVPPDAFSFPSGHTAAAFVATTLLCYWFPLMAIPMYLWASLVGLSRVYLGVHYPADVLSGACLGIMAAKGGIFFGMILFQQP